MASELEPLEQVSSLLQITTSTIQTPKHLPRYFAVLSEKVLVPRMEIRLHLQTQNVCRERVRNEERKELALPSHDLARRV
jgi:hypothetical protein